MITFSDSDIDRLVAPQALADLTATALADLGRGDARQALKQTLPTPDGRGFHLALAAVVPRFGLAVSKWASFAPAEGNAPSVSASTLIVSRATGGEPIAVVRGMSATTVRTAATAAAIVRLLRPGARRAVLIGYGAVNRRVGAALRSLLPALDEISVLTRHGGSGTAAHDRTRALSEADVVVTATGSRHPVVDFETLSPDALAVSLDGRGTWEGIASVRLLSDHDDPESPSLARAFAAPDAVPEVRFVDCAGAAVTDVALCRMLLSGAS